MDAGRASGTSVVRRVDGQDYRFPKLRLGELMELVARWRAADREALAKRCAESGLDGEALFAKLDAFDAEGMRISEYLRKPFALDGCVDILAASTDQSRDDIGALPFDRDELVGIAWEVMGNRPLAEAAARSDIKPAGSDDAPTSHATGSSTPG